jgi:ABC-type multidrug transport system ATPase subunit
MEVHVTDTAAIAVRDLTKRYRGGTLANDNLSLEIKRGEIFGLLGPNGAGKTTLVLQILGLLAPTSGRITVEGVDVVAHPQQIKTFSGYMPQTRVAMRNLEVHRALSITGRLRGQPKDVARAQAEELIERLELGEHRNQYLDRLSGGLMRVAAFAMALMGQPRLVVLDEPTNELDPLRRRAVWETIRDLNRTRPVTCVLVTHNVLEAERVVERVAVVNGGRVAAVGTPGDLKARLGDEVRLEVVLKADVSQNGHLAAVESRLATLGRMVSLRPGSYAVFVRRQNVGAAVETMMASLEGMLDDFRLAPPSLEDVYIHLAGQKLIQEAV